MFQEIAENGADTAHLRVVHGPAVFSKITHIFSLIAPFVRHSWSNINWTPHSSYSESKSEVAESIKQNSENSSHRAYMTLRHHLILFNKLKILKLDVNVQQIGPGYVELLMESFLGTVCIFQTVTPMEPLLQKVLISLNFLCNNNL